jgi:hypothetical protein
MYSDSAYADEMADESLKTPAQRLAWAREKLAGFATAEAAAEALNIPKPTQHSRENGHRGITPSAASFYNRHWKISKNWLLFGDGDPKPGTPARRKQPQLEIDNGSALQVVERPVTEPGAQPLLMRRENPHDGVRIELSEASAQVKRLATALGADQPGMELWELTSDALTAFGYLAGDFLAVNRSLEPTAGKFVLAESHTREGPICFFRLFEPPYLISGSVKSDHRRPVLVDNVTNIVAGVVFASARI